MKTIIAGSRDCNDYDELLAAIKAVSKQGWNITQVVSGCARGVDTLGERWADENNILVIRFPAAWDKHGKSAGMIRNREMADYADALIALWDGSSRGTGGMINEARKRGLKTHVHYIS